LLNLKKIAPDLEINDLHEARQMLAQNAENWIQRWEAKGRAKGIAEGIAEGIVEGEIKGEIEGKIKGERALITHLLQHKFGKLSPQQRKQLQSMTSNELLEFSDHLLEAKSLEDLFAEAYP